jgi:hypothetical protein
VTGNYFLDLTGALPGFGGYHLFGKHDIRDHAWGNDVAVYETVFSSSILLVLGDGAACIAGSHPGSTGESLPRPT